MFAFTEPCPLLSALVSLMSSSHFWIRFCVCLFVSNILQEQRLREETLSSETFVLTYFFPAFVCPRDNGTRQNRITFRRRSRTPVSDAPWRGFSRAPCSCPGCPAGPNLWPPPGGSSTPGAWELWPAACPESCKSLSLYLFPNCLPSSRLMVEWTLSINNCHFGMLLSRKPR